MKPFSELTRNGKLKRLREVASLALDAYGLSGAKLAFEHYSGNVIFRADGPGRTFPDSEHSIYVPDRYNVRILSEADSDTVSGELVWLQAMRRDAGLPVPEPVPTADGRLFLHAATPGVPNGRIVSLLRWVDGNSLRKLTPKHVKAVGEALAGFHQFTANWNIPEGFERYVYDWEGYCGERQLSNTAELVANMSDIVRPAYLAVSGEIREVMQSLGKGPDAFGLIHADLYLDNIIWRGGEPRIIDFEDAGFGYWMNDIAVFLGQWPWSEEFPRIRDAFIEGYSRVRTLPENQLKHLDLFIAAQYAMVVLWATSFMKTDVARRAEHLAWREREAAKLLKYYEARL